MNHFLKPTVFWSWNNAIVPKEAARQLNEYAEAGIGGVFVHARNVRIPYLKEEWFACFDAVINEAQKTGVDVWIYDENGWPSGFGNGEVSGKGKAFQMKRLREVSDDFPEIVCRHEGKNIGLIVEKNYVDLMDEEVVKCFIECVHEKYRARYASFFGTVIKGVFTDEPQLDNGGFPYSCKLDAFFFETYGYPLRENLWKLFTSVSEHLAFKNDYFRCVGKSMRRSFTMQIDAWCKKNGLIFTGHFPCEESLCAQASVTGGVQGHYKYMTQPGIDFLGRRYVPALLMKQIGSVKNIYDKPYVLTESFAGTGNGVSFDWLLKLYAYQAAFGINFLCMHLGAYTLSGGGKRDYPPAFSYQQPWWKDFSLFGKEVERINAFVCEGKEQNDVLLVSPLPTAAVLGYYSREQKEYSANYRLTVENLIDANIPFDIFDEEFLSETAVEGNCFLVNGKRYKWVIVPKSKNLSAALVKKLAEFSREGKLLVVGEAPSYTDGLYTGVPAWRCEFVTNRCEPLQNYFRCSGYERKFEIFTETGTPVKGIIAGKFERANGFNLMLFHKNGFALNNLTLEVSGLYTVQNEGGTLPVSVRRGEKKTTVGLSLKSGEYTTLRFDCRDGAEKIREERSLRCESERTYYPETYVQPAENYLVVDKAYYSGDGFARLHLIDELRDKTEKRDSFTVRYILETQVTAGIKMMAESCGGEIFINGQPLAGEPTYPIDRLIPCYDVEKYLVKGVNRVEIVYRDLASERRGEAGCFETVANSRARTFDLENLIFCGNFDVAAAGEREELGGGCYRIKSAEAEYPFKIASPGKGGKYFYRGTASCDFTAEIPAEGRSYLELNGLVGTFAKVFIDGRFVGSVCRQPFALAIGGFAGNRRITVEIEGNNRNIFGPFHCHRADGVFTGRDTFEGAPASFEFYDVEKEKKHFSDYSFTEIKLENIKIKNYR